jgi:hypothetical protein
MIRQTSISSALSTTLALAAGLTAGCASEEADSGAFIVRLGTDTVAVERYVRTPERFEGTAVTRSPRAMVRETVVSFAADGAVSRYESTLHDASAATDAPPQQATVIAFGPDSSVIETTQDGETETQTLPTMSPMIPSSFSHFALEELVVEQARRAGVETVYRPGDPPSPVVVRRVGPDSVILETENLGTWRAQVDGADRILGMHAGALNRTIERVADLDLDGTVRRWADEDARGVGMGPFSPRDTLRAIVGGAEITVDYSRPSKRGRLVFGGLVPWNSIWRTGANAATQLTTDQDLMMDATRVPAGTYTLFTIPRPDGWTLIVNRETGQAGTAYDSEQDLARLEIEVESLDQPVERFTISAEETNGGGVLAFTWDRTRASIPFTLVK